MTLHKLMQLRKAAIKAVQEFEDGFEYKIVCSAYGSSHTRTAKNSCVAIEIAEHYNGDNGYAVIHTDNYSLHEADLAGDFGEGVDVCYWGASY